MCCGGVYQQGKTCMVSDESYTVRGMEEGAGQGRVMYFETLIEVFGKN